MSSIESRINSRVLKEIWQDYSKTGDEKVSLFNISRVKMKSCRTTNTIFMFIQLCFYSISTCNYVRF